MSVTHRRILLALLKLFDLVLAILSYGVATFLIAHAHDRVSFEQFLSMRVKLSNFVIMAVTIYLWHVIFTMCRLYESKRLSTRREQAVGELKATTLATMCLLLVSAAFSIRMMTPMFLAAFWAISSTGMLFSRVLLRRSLASLRLRGRNLRNILILGSNPRAIEFARRIEEKPEWGYRNLGFVDSYWQGLDEFVVEGFDLVCDFQGLPEFLRNNVVDEVAIYLPLRSCYEYATTVANMCEQHGIIVRFDPDIFGLKNPKPRAETFDDDHHIAVNVGAQYGWPQMVKRALDFVISLILLLFLAPLFGVVAALIKLTSDGPVFFFQERVGFNKRRFHMCKFRTMVQGAEQMLGQLQQLNEMSGPVFKIKKDPRITPLGRFLRRTSIDELPQLWNVLKGDMSLVGPRPLPVRDYQGFNEDWQRRRFSTRPGITCLWQVTGRNSISFEQWMRLDLQYLDEWSLWLDFKILAQTIPAVLKGTGAA
jgi:exopolysaccharide biosynthesis polyprenyl glycosylphosphotransferase